jgi:hypothetical protein
LGTIRLLLRLGNGQTKTVDATRVEHFSDVHRAFEPGGEPGFMKQVENTIKTRYFLVHGEGLKKPIRAAAFEVINGNK